MYEKEVKELFEKRALLCGSCRYGDVAFSPEDSDFRSVITTVLPYWFNPEGAHNISLYSMLPDYHRLLGDILEDIVGELKTVFPENQFKAHVDVSPINEKKAAMLSGLGFIGKNTLLINEKYGSFIFIGDICTDAEIDIDNPIVENSCGDCSLCVESCPGNALCGGFDPNRCVSGLTQKKGDLSPLEENILKSGNSVWGCDICSSVCPYNANLEESLIARKYKDGLLYNITGEMLDGLSNGEFKKIYGDRAFSWRGVSVLRRNIHIVECSK